MIFIWYGKRFYPETRRAKPAEKKQVQKAKGVKQAPISKAEMEATGERLKELGQKLLKFPVYSKLVEETGRLGLELMDVPDLETPEAIRNLPANQKRTFRKWIRCRLLWLEGLKDAAGGNPGSAITQILETEIGKWEDKLELL